MSTPDRILLLNVGGKRFETSLQTVNKYPNALLARMFAAENSSLLRKDADGLVFFDRSAKLFEHVLSFYRTGKVARFDNESKNIALQEEFMFWGLEMSSCERIEQEEKKALYVAACKQLAACLPAIADGTEKFVGDLVGDNAYDFLDVLVLLNPFVDNFDILFSLTGLTVTLIDNNSVSLLGCSMNAASFHQFRLSRENVLLGLSGDLISSMQDNGLGKVLQQNDRNSIAMRVVAGRDDDVTVSICCYLVDEDGKQASSQPALVCFFTFKTKNWDVARDSLAIPPTQWSFMCALETHILQDVFSELEAIHLEEKRYGSHLVFQSDWKRKQIRIAIPYDVPNEIHCERGRILVSKDAAPQQQQQQGEQEERQQEDVKCCILPRNCFEWVKRLPKSSTTTTIYMKKDSPLLFVSNLGDSGTISLCQSIVQTM